MKLSLSSQDAARTKVALLAVPVLEGSSRPSGALPPAVVKALTVAARKAGFSGKAEKTLAVRAPRGLAAETVLLVGVDPRETLEGTRRAAGIAFGKMEEFGAASLGFVPPEDDVAHASAAAEGALLANYAFIAHKTGPHSPSSGRVLIIARRSGKEFRAVLPALSALAEGVKFARDLGNEPANVLTPVAMAERAVALAKARSKQGVRCEILGPAEIAAKGMGAFLGVAQGSTNEPRFIHLTYEPRAKLRSGRRIALVGKGLTFDSGGISIKPSQSMEEMKFDMCGAAAVLGVFHCLAELEIAHEVHGYIAACDNMPSGSAVKPGDVLVSMSGKTIEVINTDAEGRLTLVDALTEALACKPDYMVDLATLTGACAVALGAASGIMSNNDALRGALVASSDATGERAWPLPLFPDYRRQLKSPYADIKNLGERYGGALTAGLFLQDWVPDSVPWAHVDIAGSAWTLSELPYCGKGATGIGVRTLVHWLRGIA